MFTKEEIKEKLATDLQWMERGVIVLYQRQTRDEQSALQTMDANGVGFSGTDGRYLSWVAQYLLRGGHLSRHHVDKVAHKLPKYWKQIMTIIEENDARRLSGG